MKIASRIGSVVFGFLLSLPYADLAVGQGGPPPEKFFDGVPAGVLNAKQKQGMDRQQGRREAKRLNALRMRLGLDRKTAPTDDVTFNLFPDTEVKQKFRHIERRAQDYSWFGGDPASDSNSIMVVQGADIAGTIREKGKLYQIRPVGDGTQAVIEVDESLLLDHPPGPLPIAPQAALDIQLLRSVNAGSKPATSRIFLTESPPSCPAVPAAAAPTSVIRMVVAYTPAAAAQAGNIGALIQLAIDETNQAYRNSLVGSIVGVTLAYAYQTSYTEADMSTDLNRLTTTNDGFMDEVHTHRNNVGADAVALIRGSGEYCGIGWLNSGANTAFTVTSQSCATGYYSFGHELGHNIGMQHDPAVSPGTGYNHGYVNVGAKWRTIMAYNNACSSAGVNCTRIQHFSNPAGCYSGAATGTAATHDNARVLRERAATVAAFR